MDERKALPQPVTLNDMFLYDIALSLRALVDANAPPAQGETMELREPAKDKPASRKKTAGDEEKG